MQVKARTELRCLVADAQGARDKNAGVRATLEAELQSVERSIAKVRSAVHIYIAAND